MDIIALENVSKRYRIYHHKPFLLRELGKRLVGMRSAAAEFWALREVTLTVAQGECVGIIGPNGSGKTTLLSMIAGTVYPTQGQVRTTGRIAAVLGLAASFHPDLTGRENVILTAALMGVKQKQIRQELDEIVAYAELENFIDTPVRHYSSGMVARLGFAVAVSFDPDILLLDEVLAVGDQDFQHKSLARMAELREQKKTILLASHDLISLQTICQTGILLESGRAIYQGPIHEAVQRYTQESTRKQALS